MSRYFLLIMLIACSIPAFATLTPGTQLPELSIETRGLLQIDKDKAHYQPWSSKQLGGKRYVIQYISARMKPGRMNIKLNDMLYDIDHPQTCRTVSIINVADAVWGTKIFVEPELVSNQKRTPLCQIVYDAKGLGVNEWGLKTKSNATLVIDESGKILFFHEGKLSHKQMEEIIELSTPSTSCPAGNCDIKPDDNAQQQNYVPAD